MRKSFAQRRSLLLMIFGSLLLVTLAACGSSRSITALGEPAKVVTITETHRKSSDTYLFEPTRLIVKSGDTVTLKNTSDEVQHLSEGDASKAGVRVSVRSHRSRLVIFGVPGIFVIKTSEGATLTITVQ